MPQRDLYHGAVKNALIADGWTITHDPLTLPAGAQNVFVDLGAERLLAAERSQGGEIERIAVEVKTFAGRSTIADLEQALGQYLIYRALLAKQEPERSLFLAVPSHLYESVWETAVGNIAVEMYGVKLVVCDMAREVVERWER
jgi:hypothetical protein